MAGELALDHLVMTVADIDQTRRFYVDVLRMERREFAGVRVALHFRDQKIKLHPAAAPMALYVRCPTDGSADLCFVTHDTHRPTHGRFRCGGRYDQRGTGGAQRRSRARPLYCRDRDDNLIEFANRL